MSSLVAWFGGIFANGKQMRTWALFEARALSGKN